MTNKSTDIPVAVIIPFQEWNDWALECVEHCCRMDYKSITLWLLADEDPSDYWKSRLDALKPECEIIIEPTGAGNPARKRNVAIRKSDAEIFAMIDSDAYPRPDWLSMALPLLSDDVTIVTGPNLTPESDPVMRRIPGRVMATPLGFGAGYIRHYPVKQHYINEMPTCNMISRRMEGLYFRENLDTSEDIMFCSDARKLGKKIIYDPSVIVFHHRRNLFKPFMRQFFLYGLDKGRLASTRDNSTHLWQAFPALFVIYLCLLTLTLITPASVLIKTSAAIPMACYALAVFAESIRMCRSITEFIITPAVFLAAHISYGFGYLKGRLS